jgi:hypothetical protein
MTAVARLVVAIGAALALAVPASASGAQTQTNFRWSTHVPVFGTQSTPFTSFFIIDPFEASVPHVGRATIQIQFVTCSPCSPTGTASLSVRITANGGTLVLGGSSSSSSGTTNGGTWAVSEGTGRFARYTGSGTWTWMDAADDGFDVTLSLTGHLGRS